MYEEGNESIKNNVPFVFVNVRKATRATLF